MQPLEAERVKEWRHRRMLSQQEVADRAGTSLFTIQRIERGEGNVRPKTGRGVAAALGISIEELLPKAQAPLFRESSEHEPPEERREALEILFDNLRIHITGTADRWIRAAETDYAFWSEDAAIAFSIEMRDEAAHLYGFVSDALEPALERLFAGTLTLRSEQRKLIQAVEHLNRAVEMANKAADAVAPPREPTDEDWAAAIPILEQMWEEMDEVKQRQLLRDAAEELAEESERAAEKWRSRIA